MPILLSENGNKLKKIDETGFSLEDSLQEYLKNNPDIIPIYDIDEDARLLIIAREFRTDSGPIDALGVDQDGNVYVIETKLFKNADKRTVVAQAMDYGASLWRHSGGVDSVITELKRQIEKTPSFDLETMLNSYFGLDDSENLINTIADNIVEGKIKFVVLMDRVDDRLKDLITYVNQNSKFDLYAVQLKYYKQGKFEIIIPVLFGAEVKKEIGNDTPDNRFDNQLILDKLNELNLPDITLDEAHSTKTYLRFTTKYLDELMPPRTDNTSSWKNGNGYYYEISTNKSGYVRVQLALNSDGVNDKQKASQNNIINFSKRDPKRSEWRWFIPKSWKVDSQSGQDKTLTDIKRIITKEIPKFENTLKKSIQ